MFQFKQFRIEQDRCAMKVGTDSILLGAWTSPPFAGKILDVGSGTGILALMMAQKSKDCSIDAVELDKVAASQCKENVANSPWSDRIEVFTTSIQDFRPEHSYDLIISNPPYFSDGLSSNYAQRSLARQGKDLNNSALLTQINRLISNTGTCAVILPNSSFEGLGEIVNEHELNIYKICRVCATPRKDPHRVLLLIGREKKSLEEECLIVQTGGPNEYSQAYRDLTEDFYLNLS